MSRLPIVAPSVFEDNDDEAIVQSLNGLLVNSTVSKTDLHTESRIDSTIQQMISYVVKSWPHKSHIDDQR